MSSLLPDDFRAILRGPVLVYYVTTIMGCVGVGLTLSLSVVYVHDIRHHSISFATSLLALNALVALAITPLVGTLVDRLGPIRVLVVGTVGEALSVVMFSRALSPWTLMTASLLIAATNTATWGPSSVLLTRMVPVALRQRAYGANFMLVNLGIALGGLISATIVNLHHPSTFVHLYEGAGVIYALTIIPLLSLRRFGRAVKDTETRPAGERSGWSLVLRDRRLLHYVVAAFILMGAGYGSLEAGFSLFVVQNVHLPVNAIGVIFFFNTLTIVVGQLFTLRFIEGRSRTRVMGLVGVLWALSWLLIALSARTPHWLALAILCVSLVIFAIAETFWSPVAPAVVNDIAPEHLRGRYNAASGLTWSLSGGVAPLFAGLLLGSHLAGAWPLFVALGSALGGAVALSLRRSLSPSEDGLSTPTPS